MTADELRAALSVVPGVGSVEVTDTGDATPNVRVWLDGTRPAEDVQRDVDHVIGLKGYRRRPVPRSESAGGSVATAERTTVTVAESAGPNGRRGLGRGLDTLLPVAVESSGPAEARPGRGRAEVRFARLAIEEGPRGVTVRAISAAGVEEAVFVQGEGERALLEAVAMAVGGLRGRAPRLLGISDDDVAGVHVVTAVVELPEGTKAAGASILVGSRPFTVGRAVDQALSGLEAPLQLP